MKKIKIIGGGLAGCECAYQLLKRGHNVTLVDMKPNEKSPAHKLNTLCELVCSNSLKSNDINTSSGLLKAEMRHFDSLVLNCAFESKVPAGNALAVDREMLSEKVTQKLHSFDNFTFKIENATSITPETDEILVVATGPLTSNALLPALEEVFSSKFLYFFDAVAPIVELDSVDMNYAFVGDRYGKGSGDYINCPMTKDEFEAFWHELVTAETAPVEDFENDVFEGCMPIEVMAKRGKDSIRFGPMKPVGLTFNGTRPYAVLQLRKENESGSLVNLVGFQTHLKWGEQKRVFSMIPALKNAEFVRYGVMHKNIFINSPLYLNKDFSLKSNPNVYFAGQICGVEGYVESCMTGLVVALQIDRRLQNKPQIDFPIDTMMGALCNHVVTVSQDFQPMNSNFGILPPLQVQIRDKSKKKQALSERALESIKNISNNL